MNISQELIEHYCETHTSRINPLLAELIEYTESNHTGAGMLTGAFQGIFLSMLSRTIQPKNILEIGTYTGFSALCMTEGLQAEGRLYTFEINPKLKATHDQFIRNHPKGSQIEIIYGDANVLLPEMDIIFDLVYIDGTKKDYAFLLETALEKLSPHGSILVDNVLWKGKVLSTEEIQKDKNTAILALFNSSVAADPRFTKIMLPIRDGLYWIMKN